MANEIGSKLISESPFIPGRGRDFCRGCNDTDLFSALNLGDLPIANELWPDEHEIIEVFPLHLRVCNKCGLGQVEDVVTPTRLFRDYRYLSSMSAGFIEHARVFAMEVANQLQFQDEDWVLEIASNDGYLLRHFIEMGIKVLGVEPAQNVAKIAVDAGIPTISEFFGQELALSLTKSHGYPKLVVANNVMAHVPDIRDFIAGLAIISDPDTLISIENPSLMNFLQGDQFDTIYHEHFSYLTSNSVKTMAAEFGLSLFHVEEIETHGGSNRYWLRHSSHSKAPVESVERLISQESENGLFNQEDWKAFASRIEATIQNFHNWLQRADKEGKKIYGFGAAAKASTLLNASKVEKSWITGIADASYEKQGRFMPVQGIPIIAPEQMFEMDPTDIVIFPWNIREELVKVIKQNSPTTTRIWRAVPALELLS